MPRPSKKLVLQGAMTALITPFRNGKIDEQAFEKIVDWQIKQGIHGLVPCGTTGESPTLDHDEHQRVIALCINVAKKRAPVIAGTGSNATHEAIAMTQAAEKAGADAALLVCPYYNKPTPEGLYQHFKAIHDHTGLPLVVYNVPGRTMVNMSNELIARIAALPRVIGIKDATGDLSRPQDLAKKAPKLIQISGEDDQAVSFNRIGGKGIISVTSNVAPKLCAEMQSASLKGAWEEAEEIQQRLMPVHKAMFCETSPGPVKYAMSLMGFCGPEMRLPLVLPTEEHQEQIRKTMKAAGLL